jgi:hypothetical protein
MACAHLIVPIDVADLGCIARAARKQFHSTSTDPADSIVDRPTATDLAASVCPEPVGRDRLHLADNGTQDSGQSLNKSVAATVTRSPHERRSFLEKLSS